MKENILAALIELAASSFLLFFSSLEKRAGKGVALRGLLGLACSFILSSSYFLLRWVSRGKRAEREQGPTSITLTVNTQYSMKKQQTIKFKVRPKELAGQTYYIHLNGLVATEMEDGSIQWLTAKEFNELQAQSSSTHPVAS